MTLRVDFDRDLWLYVPTQWPWMGYARPEDWRDAVVAAVGDAHGYDRSLRDWLGATLEGMVRGATPGEERFAYLARPHETIGMASLYEWASSPDAELDDLLGIRGDVSIRPPQVTPIEGAGLGHGTKAVRFVDESRTNADAGTAGSAGRSGGAATIVGVAHWVWRLADRDVIMIAGDADLARFEQLQGPLDDLARSISLAAEDQIPEHPNPDERTTS